MIIQSKRVYFEEQLLPLQIEIKDDKIFALHQYNQFKVDKDYGDLMILPGLCDVHTHGYKGGTVNDATKEWLKEWTEYLPCEGVTSVVAGLSSHEKGALLKACKNIGEYIDENHDGTRVIGIYEEGPFICSGKERGAQALEYQIIPDTKVIDEFNDASNNHLIYVMIAPEMLEGNYEVIDYCRSLGMAVSLGHTGATFEVCSEAIAHGANSFTHTFNGMKGLHHREPAVVGAAMYYDNCYAELIADGLHVEKHAANILAKTKGKDKLLIITDSVEAKGIPAGRYFEGTKNEVIIGEDGIVRLPSGTLSGSCRKLCDNLWFAINEENIPFVTAVNACTINPMKLFNINDRGLIKGGYLADLAIFNDKFEVQDVYIGGKQWSL